MLCDNFCINSTEVDISQWASKRETACHFNLVTDLVKDSTSFIQWGSSHFCLEQKSTESKRIRIVMIIFFEVSDMWEV